jgi:pSer/pThr/pTyr-binding forkhead associated (FHA) protein
MPTDPAPIQRWTAHVTADRAYFASVRSADDPHEIPTEFPASRPARTFVLSGERVRIGRRRIFGISPEIDLGIPPADPGVSHLHAILLAQPDGGWALLDPGSTNGTWLNDASEPVDVGVVVPLKPGDRINLGAWTSIAFTVA